jgi:formylglycine-generating enzyme required for sulfatase activity
MSTRLSLEPAPVRESVASAVAGIIRPERKVIALPGGAPIAFQRIGAGSFQMGSRDGFSNEEPIHGVRIAQAFYMGTYPVTQGQFAAWTAGAAYAEWAAVAISRKLMEDGKRHENYFKNKPDHPAEQVTWHEAAAFCEWMNLECRPALDGVEPGLVATLPNEAQWEYACRAETDTEYHTGDGVEALNAAGWFEENSGNGTRPVGRKEPNGFGLHDMHGNVWEWCTDVWDAVAYRKPADAGMNAEYWREEDRKRQDPLRVLRGGSWLVSARYCRSAYRFRFDPVNRFWLNGFRVCLVPGPLDEPERGALQTEQAKPVTGAGERGTSTQAKGAGGADVDLAKEKMPPAQRAE